MIRFVFILMVIVQSSVCLSQSTEERVALGRKSAENELNQTLKYRKEHPKTGSKRLDIIKDSVTVIAIAEAILFNIYGKHEIIIQRPYEIYPIKNYWVLKGTLSIGIGGTFTIILDAKDCRVIKMTHGK